MALSAIALLTAISLIGFSQPHFHTISLGGQSLSDTPSQADQNFESELKWLLKNCLEYCERLLNSSFRIQCEEEIRERIYHSHTGKGRILDLEESRQFKGSEVSTYVYDFQLLYNGEAREENRVLKLENDQEKNIGNAQLRTNYFKIDFMVFEPIQFLSAENQQFFEYRIVGTQKLNDVDVYVIQLMSTDLIASEGISGRMWVEKVDFSVMRMEFEMKSSGIMQGVTKSGETFQVDSRRVVKVEYLYKIGGIRFPSLCHVKESLLAPTMKTGFPRAEISITYRNYKTIQGQNSAWTM